MEKKFGGQAENLKEFFPPVNTMPSQSKRVSNNDSHQRINSNNFKNQSINNEDIISESDYEYRSCVSYQTILEQNIEILDFDKPQFEVPGMMYINSKQQSEENIQVKKWGCGCGEDKKCSIF